MRDLLIGAACGVLLVFAVGYLTLRMSELMVERAVRTVAE